MIYDLSDLSVLDDLDHDLSDLFVRGVQHSQNEETQRRTNKKKEETYALQPRGTSAKT